MPLDPPGYAYGPHFISCRTVACVLSAFRSLAQATWTVKFLARLASRVQAHPRLANERKENGGRSLRTRNISLVVFVKLCRVFVRLTYCVTALSRWLRETGWLRETFNFSRRRVEGTVPNECGLKMANGNSAYRATYSTGTSGTNNRCQAVGGFRPIASHGSRVNL